MLAQLLNREKLSLKVLVGTEENDHLVSRGGPLVCQRAKGDDVYVFHRDSKMFVTIDDGALLSSHVYLSGGERDTLFSRTLTLKICLTSGKGIPASCSYG